MMNAVHAECGKPTQGSTGDSKRECDCHGSLTERLKFEDDSGPRAVGASSMKHWTLTLPMIPLSMNKRERSNRWVLIKELQQITHAIFILAREHRIPPATGKRRVVVEIHKTKRSRVTDDPANKDSRAKSILDAMVANGLLLDDSDKWLEWGHVHEGEKRDAEETVITIEECST